MKTRKYLLPILPIVFFILTPAIAADTPLMITPSKILAGEDQAVLFSISVDCQQASCPESMELILWKDKTEQKSKARWSLQDNGLWGDEKAGDKIYSRQAFFKKESPSTLFFTAGGKSDAELQIIPRPTFLELLKNLIKKFKVP